MTDKPSSTTTSSTTWAVISIACLILGLAVGYVVFGHRAATPVVTPVARQQAVTPPGTPPAGLFDERSAQALRDILARDPKNLQAAVQLGNLYYDAGRYAEAVPPYQQAFALAPSNVNVSTDLGTALYYSGRPDEALAQYEKSLAIDPNHGQTLFNQGIVWHDGKQNVPRAIQSWEKLLATNPDYKDRAKVEQLLAQARERVGSPPAAPVRSTK